MNYVVYGEEQYQVKQMIRSIVMKEVGSFDDMNVIRYDALQTSMDVILEDVQTIPFFSNRKVIIVDHSNFLSSNNDTDLDLEQMLTYLRQPLDSSVLILSGDFAKMDTRKKIVKEISKLCQVSVYNRLDKQSLPGFLHSEIGKRNLQLDAMAFQELLRRLPYDIATIQNELDKLALYAQSITEKDVKALITRTLEEDVFALVNAVVEKNSKRCFAIWQDLCVLNKDPIYLIALLASQFHLLYQVKVQLMKRNANQDAIAKTLEVHPYRVKLAIGVANTLSIDELMCVLADLAQLDQNLKNGKIDKQLGFELFLLGVKK